MNITVVGTGYVGLANAVLLSQYNQVFAVDIDKDKIDKINNKISPISDKEIEHYLANKNLNLIATMDSVRAYQTADFVIICTPTNYDDEKNYFDTSSVESVIQQVLQINSRATIVIKSTVPVGYTKSLIDKFGTINIIFSPEFLREGHALYDNLYPSRIIIGLPHKENQLENKAIKLLTLLKNGAIKENIPSMLINSTEAEAIKLFANTYLALRVSYFNELDTYCATKGLNTRSIIEGIGYDPRIGNHYNNPSFGYGGYCLPKDTKQLRANYKDVPENLISAIVSANDTRKDFISYEILKLAKIRQQTPIIGIYRLTMKAGSDNFRQSAVIGVINRLLKFKVNVIIYEPTIQAETFNNCTIVNDFNIFVKTSTLVVANRYDQQLKHCHNKLFTRDIFSRD